MRALAVARRELRGALDQPLAYVLVGAFAALSAAFFFVLAPFFAEARTTLRPFFEFAPFALTLFAPALAMRTLAEEARGGGLDLLLSWPLDPGVVVAGKFLGAWGVLGLALLCTAGLPITVSALGPLDWGPVLAGYLGLFLYGGACLAIGVFASAMSSHQVVAFIGGFTACFALYLAGRAQVVLPAGLASIAHAIGFEARVTGFARGVVDTGDVAFFVAVMVGALGLAREAVDARRWR